MNRMIDITSGHFGSVLAKIAITLLAIADAVIWGILTLLYCVSWIGNGSLIFALVIFAEAHAKTEGWCAPASVALKFSDQQEREAVKIELRSSTQTCTIYDVDEAVGLYRQPEMHIDFYGKAFSVPNSCLMGFSFRLSDLLVSIGDRGIGVRILGKSIDRGTRMRAVVYTVDNDVLCNQSAE